jgi:3-methyl-2-oxobutanoate hydroxymethyltransferase
MARLTVGDLQRMKRDGKKIAATVVYEFQMAKICERAGADLLSVGDSLGRNFLGYTNPDDFKIDEMIPFAKAVVRAAERAVVNVDMPTGTCKAGPKEVAQAALRIKDEVGANMTKVDIREEEEKLFDSVRAVLEIGLPVYPQIGFAFIAGGELHGSPADHDHIMKWAHALEDAGACMIDLTQVTHGIYADVCKSLKIPVIGGQTGPEADGRIYVSYSLVGYQAAALDRTGPSAARFIYDIAKKAVDGVHAGQW